MHGADHVRGAERPALSQHDVVDFLKRNAGVFADEVYGIEDVLNADHFDVPGAFLTEDHFAQSIGGRAMPAAGIHIDQSDFFRHRYSDFPDAASARFRRASAREGSLPSGSCSTYTRK